MTLHPGFIHWSNHNCFRRSLIAVIIWLQKVAVNMIIIHMLSNNCGRSCPFSPPALNLMWKAEVFQDTVCVLFQHSWWVHCVLFFLLSGAARGAGSHLSLCPLPQPTSTPPRPSIPPPPQLSALSFLLRAFFQGSAHSLLATTTCPPLSSQTALLHQFCTVPAWRGVKERKEDREERIWWTEERRTGERDHGRSLCLAEDLGNTADFVPGSGPSGEWTGEVWTCFILGFSGDKGPWQGLVGTWYLVVML